MLHLPIANSLPCLALEVKGFVEVCSGEGLSGGGVPGLCVEGMSEGDGECVTTYCREDGFDRSTRECQAVAEGIAFQALNVILVDSDGGDYFV